MRRPPFLFTPLPPAHLRLTRLMVVAALRAAGPVPWLLAISWMTLAVLQEPRLLRHFDLHLAAHATWSAAILVALVLSFSSGRAGGPVVPYLLSRYILATIPWAMFSAGLVAVELPRVGGYGTASLLNVWPVVFLAAPLVVTIQLAVQHRSAFTWIFALVASPLVLSLLVRFHGAGWSASDLVASIALSVATAALVGVHRRPKL